MLSPLLLLSPDKPVVRSRPTVPWGQSCSTRLCPIRPGFYSSCPQDPRLDTDLTCRCACADTWSSTSGIGRHPLFLFVFPCNCHTCPLHISPPLLYTHLTEKQHGPGKWLLYGRYHNWSRVFGFGISDLSFGGLHVDPGVTIDLW